MLFLLIPFIPAIKETVVNVLIPSLAGSGVDKKNIKELSKHLYAKIPQNVRIVNEDVFVEFCMKYQEHLFPQKIKTGKTTLKKAIAKKVVKPIKKTVKKATKKK